MSNFNIINLDKAKAVARGDNNVRGLISFSLIPHSVGFFKSQGSYGPITGLLKNKPKFSIAAEYDRLINMDESFANINKGLSVVLGRGVGFSKGWSRKIYKGGSYMSLSLQSRIIDDVINNTRRLSSYCAPSKDNEQGTKDMNDAVVYEQKAESEKAKIRAAETAKKQAEADARYANEQKDTGVFPTLKNAGATVVDFLNPFGQTNHKVFGTQPKVAPKVKEVDKSAEPEGLAVSLMKGALNYSPPLCTLEIGNYFKMSGFYVKSVDWEYSHEQNVDGPLYADVNIELENFEIKLSEDIINAFHGVHSGIGNYSNG